MTLEILIEIIKEYVEARIRCKDTGKVGFEINISQGGIGECKISTETKIK